MDYSLNMQRLLNHLFIDKIKKMDKPNFGIIGTGNISIYYYYSLKKLKLNLVACCSRSKNNPLFKKDKITHYTNVLDLISSTKIDVIIIATPPSSHYELVKLCLNHKKIVICEKPPTITLKEYKELVNLSHETKTKLYIAYHARFQPAFLYAKKIINKLKKEHAITKVTISYRENVRLYHHGSSWIFKKKISGGGCLIDSGINAISVVDSILGPIMPVKCKLSSRFKTSDLETNIQAVLENKNHVPIQLKMDWLSDIEERRFTFYFNNKALVSFNFSDSSIIIRDKNKYKRKNITVISPLGKIKTSMYEEYENLLKDFLQFYKRNNLINKIAESPLKTIMAIYKSYKISFDM